MEKQYFEKSDGWLFSTLKCFRENEKITLYKIISIGDTINHAIFTLNEINEGLSRLISDNYIELENDHVKITMKGQKFIKFNRKKHELCIAEQVRFSDIFQSTVVKNQTIYKKYFSTQEYDDAIKKYCK